MDRRTFLAAAAGMAGRARPAARAGSLPPAPSLLERDPRGWIDLSPGPRLEGWTEYPWFDQEGEAWRGARQWHMDPATAILTCDGHRDAHTMFLHDGEHGDFVLHVEWRFAPAAGRPAGYAGYNSGVLVRMLPETPERKVMHQVETGAVPARCGWLRGGSLERGLLTVLDTRVFSRGAWRRVDPGFPRGWRPHVVRVDPTSDPSGLPSAYDVGVDAPVHPPGVWNTYEVVCRGRQIRVWTNGVETCRAGNARVLRGRVGLEAEWHRIDFRRLRLKEL